MINDALLDQVLHPEQLKITDLRNNLYPISMNEVVSLMKNRPIKSVLPQDHHEITENYK
jgi:hypothetical protein